MCSSINEQCGKMGAKIAPALHHGREGDPVGRARTWSVLLDETGMGWGLVLMGLRAGSKLFVRRVAARDLLSVAIVVMNGFGLELTVMHARELSQE